MLAGGLGGRRQRLRLGPGWLRGRELDVAEFALDLAAESIDDHEEARSGEFFYAAAVEFAFQLLESARQGAGAIFPPFDEFFSEGFEFSSMKFLDVAFELAVPPDEGVAGDFEFARNVGDAPTFGAEFDETYYLFRIFHIFAEQYGTGFWGDGWRAEKDAT